MNLRDQLEMLLSWFKLVRNNQSESNGCFRGCFQLL